MNREKEGGRQVKHIITPLRFQLTFDYLKSEHFELKAILEHFKIIKVLGDQRTWKGESFYFLTVTHLRDQR